ncbi:MAG: hypothetical protein KatS3mg064_1174 [Tepidiforma sp.]|nr:MAG: hypothetical protein KatS3mg064_1174 [Tepidiforma sp.]
MTSSISSGRGSRGGRGGGRREKGEGRREKGDGRRETGDGRRELGVGSWELGVGSWELGESVKRAPGASTFQPHRGPSRAGRSGGVVVAGLRPRGAPCAQRMSREAGSGGRVNANGGVGLAGPPRARRPATTGGGRREQGGGRWEPGGGRREAGAGRREQGGGRWEPGGGRREGGRIRRPGWASPALRGHGGPRLRGWERGTGNGERGTGKKDNRQPPTPTSNLLSLLPSPFSLTLPGGTPRPCGGGVRGHRRGFRRGRIRGGRCARGRGRPSGGGSARG